jgi:uncharacterized protein (DUF2267 family)
MSLVDAKQFYRTVAERAGLSREESADLTRATLCTLAERLSAGEARDLAIHLPDPLTESLRSCNSSAKRFGLDEFIRRVSAHTGLTVPETTQGLQAVFTTLRETIPTEAYQHAMSQLPRDFHALAPATGTPR